MTGILSLVYTAQNKTQKTKNKKNYKKENTFDREKSQVLIGG